jgi:hypothetical protein
MPKLSVVRKSPLASVVGNRRISFKLTSDSFGIRPLGSFDSKSEMAF